MKTLQAYKNDPVLKANFLKEIEKHRKADAIAQGTYGRENGTWKGCAVACSLRSLAIMNGEELKDAGFPQADSPFISPHGAIIAVGVDGDIDSITSEYPYIPTLSELIEACGDDFILLVQTGHDDGREWGADGGELSRIYGSTPEEAVARLWLALNTKDV